MPVDSESTAKAFFVNKIIEQAEREGIPLSKAQRYTLAWSETDPSFVVDMELSKQCEAEIPQPEYEKKIKGLIERMFKRDIETNKSLKETYKEAYKTLKQGDHFILIMIGDAIGSKLSWFRLF
ncbi:MAG TPA: hypothetical protein VL197_15120 [Nitrospirota bacterium]|nr:hypothetical protein [Nitrospirota bacterium]